MKHTRRVLPLLAILALVLLSGCATPAMRSEPTIPTPAPEARAVLDSTTPLLPDRIAATSFIDDLNGWAVGGELEDGVGSLVQRTTDGGRT